MQQAFHLSRASATASVSRSCFCCSDSCVHLGAYTLSRCCCSTLSRYCLKQVPSDRPALPPSHHEGKCCCPHASTSRCECSFGLLACAVCRLVLGESGVTGSLITFHRVWSKVYRHLTCCFMRLCLAEWIDLMFDDKPHSMSLPRHPSGERPRS